MVHIKLDKETAEDLEEGLSLIFENPDRLLNLDREQLRLMCALQELYTAVKNKMQSI